MTFNEAIVRHALLIELNQIKNIKSTALTEKILLTIHYRKAFEEWLKACRIIKAECNGDVDAENTAANAKANEDCGLEYRYMTVDSFSQIVEAANNIDTIQSALINNKMPVSDWLLSFADVFVKV